MNITVVGGGNIGTQFAVHCAEKGHSVRLFTSNPDHFAKRLTIVDKSGAVIHEGDIEFATSNPILHTARLMTIFSDYEPGVTYDSLPLFYEDWDDASSELLLACDDEIQEICRALPGFGLEYVVSEREFYNADTAEELTHAIRTEESLHGLTTPSVRSDSFRSKGRGLPGFRKDRMQRWLHIEQHARRRSEWRTALEKIRGRCDEAGSIPVSTGLIPDLHSRYFTADFPYGLFVIKQIGDIAGVAMPDIEMLIDWYDNIALVNDKLYLSDYGISNMDDLKEFYLI